VDYIKQKINDYDFATKWRGLIAINTVDGFQGQEKEIICISLVRSNDKSEIGFLSDTRRMNVALTRAKKKLIVIGDSATIGSHPFYEKFISYVEEVDAYTSVWEIGEV
jgi:superfamily I DNA and/or RNA helicase